MKVLFDLLRKAVFSYSRFLEEDIIYYTEELGEKLKQELDIPIALEPLDAEQSKFFKTVYQNPSRNPQQQFVIDPE